MAPPRSTRLRSATFSLFAGAWLLCEVQAVDFGGLVGSLFGAGGSSSNTGPKHVTDELDDKTIEPFLKANAVTAVLFYAPWCFYSQQAMPQWDLAGQKLKIHDPPVRLAKVDAHKYGSVGQKYGISAYPMMKLFIDGQTFEFDSSQGRGWQQIVKWVNTHLDRDHVLKNVEDVEHYLNDNDLNVIGLFGDGADSSVFGKSSRHFEDISFAESRGTQNSTEIGQALARHAMLVCETVDVGESENNTRTVDLPRGKMECSDKPRNPQRPEWGDSFHPTVEGLKVTVKRTDETGGWQQNLQLKCCDTQTGEHKLPQIPVPSLVMFMPHDERWAIYDGKIDDLAAIDKWISSRRTPMVMRLTEDTVSTIMSSARPDQVPVLFLITNKENDEIEKAVREAAKTLRGRVLVALCGTSSQIEQRVMQLAGADEDQLPVVTLIAGVANGNYRDAKKYRMDTAGITSQKVVDFVSDFEAGKLKPWLRSEPLPPREESNAAVGVLVGYNFKEVSQDNTVDVLVDFYAPWCGHCRKFEPKYKALGERLQHVTSLKITKLDATRNEVEGMAITGFPTIVLFVAGESSPKRQVHYSGNREPDHMVGWLHEHCGIKFDDRPPPEAEKNTTGGGLLDAAEEAADL